MLAILVNAKSFKWNYTALFLKSPLGFAYNSMKSSVTTASIMPKVFLDFEPYLNNEYVDSPVSSYAINLKTLNSPVLGSVKDENLPLDLILEGTFFNLNWSEVLIFLLLLWKNLGSWSIATHPFWHATIIVSSKLNVQFLSYLCKLLKSTLSTENYSFILSSGSWTL